MKQGGYFLHEHPASARSWREPSIQRLRNSPGVYMVKADQCAYGLVTPDKNGKLTPAKKATRFLTNSRAMAELLQRQCSNDHTHQHLEGGRCAAAAFYPLQLVRTMIRGMSDQATLDKVRRQEERESIQWFNAIEHKSDVVNQKDPKPRTSKVTRTNGTTIPVTYNLCNFKQQYVDEYAGEILDPHLIADAIIDELEYFNDHVWHIEDKATMLGIPEHIFVRSRWVMCNKGEAINPDMRARLVNKEG